MALVLFAAMAAAEPVTFGHHDWDVACDNTGTCRAAGYHADDAERLVSVLLTRRAGPSTPVEAELQLGEEDTLPASVAFVIDGRPLGSVALRGGGGTLSDAQRDALLAALRRDAVISFASEDALWILSGSGASAVLLKMDEAQGRLGTPGALVRKGTRAEASVPPAVPAPAVVPAPVAATRDADRALMADHAFRAAMAAVLERDECGLDGDRDGPAEYEAWRLSDDKLLVSTPCWLAAYNAGSGFWVVDDAPPFAAVFVTRSGTGYEAGEISADHKGRGPGDCWSRETWRWDGAAFARVFLANSGQCKGFLGGAWSQPSYVTRQ